MKNCKTGHAHPIVCLDPGHDSDKANPSPVVAGYYEGDRMWKLAQLLKPALEDYGIQVVLTKSQVNQTVDLVPRGKASAGADLFVSLHSNAAASTAPDWVLVLHQVEDDCGAIDQQSKDFAKLLAPAAAEVMGVSSQVYSVKSASDRDGNGYADDYYGVLRGAHTVGTAGVIVEHGFHTNEKCARWLLEDANLQRLAEKEAQIIAQWFDVQKETTGEHWYRIRKSWEDAGSQIGAYLVLDNAINACSAGYTVFDWNGAAVYAPAASYTQQQFIKEVQAAIGAAVDGLVGPETLSKLPTLAANKNVWHPAVLPVQKRLQALGYAVVGTPDGIAGPLFGKAVKAYQQKIGGAVDGEMTAGAYTWQRLLAEA